MASFFKTWNKWSIALITLVVLTLIGWGGRIGQTEDEIRAAAILTTGYVASAVFDADRANQLNLECLFTIGSATACRVKVEFSKDKTNWVQETDVTLSGGVATHGPVEHRRTVTGNFDIAIPGPNYRHYRVSAYAEDNATGTSLAITGIKSRL